jgi:hypothetical protein
VAGFTDYVGRVASDGRGIEMVFDDSERERFQFDRREFEPVDPNECPECGGEKDEDWELCEDCQWDEFDAEEE